MDRLSEYWVVGLMDCRTNGLSDLWAVRIMACNQLCFDGESGLFFKDGLKFYTFTYDNVIDVKSRFLLRLPKDADVEFKEDIYIHIKEGKRTKRSADDIFHPETFDFDFSMEGFPVHIHLKRNYHIKPNVPTFILKSDTITPRDVSDNEESIFYQDFFNGAVFVMQIDRTSSSSMMDAMYKNIQTTSYSIAINFAGIVISKTRSDSSWTESIKLTSVSPFQVDSSDALTNFEKWVQSRTGSLPGHDHAMLFTRYDLTSNGSSSNAGLAYVGAVCSAKSQSVVEDHFNFEMSTVAAHELGHSLGASHDGDGNECSFNDSYIMASSNGPQEPGSDTATNPWKFSSCSTNYFTNYIDTLESNSANCMLSLSPSFNATALSEFGNDVAGQVYDAHAQCENIVGHGSYLCTDRYYGNFSTICTVMWCAVPDKTTYCRKKLAAEGTLCGNQMWCISGVCTTDVNAPLGDEICLYGDKIGPVFKNGWTCTDMMNNSPRYCNNSAIHMKCCHSCALYLKTSTASKPSSTYTNDVETTSYTEPISTSSVPPLTLGVDDQCQSILEQDRFCAENYIKETLHPFARQCGAQIPPIHHHVGQLQHWMEPYVGISSGVCLEYAPRIRKAPSGDVAQLKNTTNDHGSSLDSSILSDSLEYTTYVVHHSLSDQASQSDSSKTPHPISSSEQHQSTISGIPKPSQTIYEYSSSSYVLPLQSSYMPIGHQVPSLSDHVQTYTTFDQATFPNSIVSSPSSKHTPPERSYMPSSSTSYSVNSLPVLLSSDTLQSTNNNMIQSTDIIMPTQTIYVQPSFSITNSISFPSTKIQKQPRQPQRHN
ncbi:unnamed protein product [Mytilus edulis]|uniref:Peptidase M12B domain-containing protein n=1 Tax=Mytilus edulis TaxID=6550 RepID=A0A8S3T7S7_MYTED|nr:unnamed protein product [Mytilus edulis]